MAIQPSTPFGQLRLLPRCLTCSARPHARIVRADVSCHLILRCCVEDRKDVLSLDRRQGMLILRLACDEPWGGDGCLPLGRYHLTTPTFSSLAPSKPIGQLGQLFTHRYLATVRSGVRHRALIPLQPCKNWSLAVRHALQSALCELLCRPATA